MVHGHTVAAVIVAAGASRRMGFDKLAYPLDGGTVLEKSVRAFDTHPAIDEILLVAGRKRSAGSAAGRGPVPSPQRP